MVNLISPEQIFREPGLALLARWCETTHPHAFEAFLLGATHIQVDQKNIFYKIQIPLLTNNKNG
jgi:hypothetical protein